MLVFWEQRLVVLATPKTGSTAINIAVSPRSALYIRNPPQLRHVTVQRYHLFVKPWLEDAAQDQFRVVAMMREPTSWLGSWYRYRMRDDVPPANSTKGKSFDSFVAAWCREQRPSFAAVGSQERFLRPTMAGHWLDRLFLYEEMDDFVNFLQAELDITIKLDRHNTSPPANLVLSDETRALVRQAGSHDFFMYENLKPSQKLKRPRKPKPKPQPSGQS